MKYTTSVVYMMGKYYFYVRYSDRVANGAARLDKDIDKIENLYNSGLSIVNISTMYDLSAVSILRRFYQRWVELENPTMKFKLRNGIVKDIIRENIDVCAKYLTDSDLYQLQQAKLIDQLSYATDIDNEGEKNESFAWETSLYDYLDNMGVKYMTEEDLMSIGSPNTPDCVFLDDVYINNKLVRWIDCKNYYGSSRSRVFLSKTLTQSNRYDNCFQGKGAIIYKLGYSNDLKMKITNSLLLDRGPLSRPK